MIDLPPEPPALPSKPPEEGLMNCGLDKRGFTVIYDEDLQGYVIEISTRAGVHGENLQCVWDATWSEFVQFEDGELQRDYDELSHARFEPLARQSALDHLTKRGLLEGLPNRSAFSSIEEFAVAVERHCGFEAHQVLGVSGDTLMFAPVIGPADFSSYEQMACLLATLRASGETKFGFIGNEAVAPSED